MVFAGGTDDAKVLKDLREMIAKVRTMSGPSMARTNAAEALSQLTKNIDPKKVDDKTLRDLVSLLDTPDGSVRLRVAAALGNLGPRAKMAVPALLRVIRETDCPPKIETGVTLSATALVALKRIGVEPPPPDCKEK
jgi:HEAT repeat protein